MAPTGATDRHREIAPTLGLVRGKHAREQVVEAVEERLSRGSLEHVVADRLVETGQRAERRRPSAGSAGTARPSRCRRRAAGRACSRSSRSPPGGAPTPESSNAPTSRSFNWCTLRSVVSITRSTASRSRLEALALELDRLEQPVGLVGERVLASRRVVPAHQLARRRVEVDDRDAMAGGAHRAHVRQHVGVLATGHERQPVDAATGLRRQLDDRRQQRRRQVVDDVEPEVLEDRRGGRSARPGKPGDEHDVRHRRRTLATVDASQTEVQQARDGCRQGVLRCHREEPRRRRRFDHPLEHEPVVGESVHVARQRSVQEPDVHTELDLLVGLGLVEVRTDPPVLLGRVEDLIVDPAAVRGSAGVDG